jgi:hypothetical protein
MKFGKLEIEPAKNPAVLDSATWDPEKAWDIIGSLGERYWQSMHEAIMRKQDLPVNERCFPHSASCARHEGSDFLLASLADGQQVFIEIATAGRNTLLTEPIGRKSLGRDCYITAYRTDAAVIDRYVRLAKPEKAPKAMGATPRLGIGTRMSTAVWPGIWQAMDKGGFFANAIQNSVREVSVLEDILAGKPPRTNYLFGFGTIEEGHTGSTFEGLWVAGVLEALKTQTHPRFGADADHIMVKRGPEGISRAKRVIDAARCYTFFTLDVSDILDHSAMSIGSDSTAETYLTGNTSHPKQRKAVLTYHSEKRHIAGQVYELDKAAVGRVVGKYWAALSALEQLYNHIRTLKDEIHFDLELSIDENPPEVDTFDCLTTETELIFLMLEMKRREIPLTHIAPNFGIEKGLDYRGSDGLIGLEKRIQRLYHIASEFGVLLDCHSGDDLKSATRKAVGRATGGEVHFKISPVLQVIFAHVLSEFDPEQFAFWWDDTLDYARREAARGSDFAANCLHQYETSNDQTPSPNHAVFHYYNFATVGRRDENGQFIHRQKFYDLPADFYRQYQDRIALYLREVANDVFGGAT